MRPRTLDAILNNYRLPTGKRGFTVIELLIVVVVIAILAALTLAVFNGVRRSASEATAKTELSASAKGFSTDQLLAPTQNNPTGSPHLLRETANNTIAYSHGNTQSYCMEVRSKTDSNVVFYQFSGARPTSIMAGPCPTPNYRTTYRCVMGNVTSIYTLTNTSSRSVSFKINHSSTDAEENYAAIEPGATRSGSTSLRVTNVQHGVINFELYDYATNEYIDTYYQANPAVSC